MRVLLVEDNLLTVKGLRFLLEHEGFEVEVATNAASTFERISSHLYDIILLDVGLPDKNGFEVADKLKQFTKDTPVIFLTAKDDEDSVVRGLELGADDYITKPFRNRELMTRIRAVLRRENKQTGVIKCGDLVLNTKKNTLMVKNREVELSALEYKIIYLLMVNAGQIITRDRLLDEIWDLSGNIVNDNTLTVYIKRIREKIGDEYIQTIKGMGYKLEPQ